MKICPVGAELFHADGRMEKTKLIVAFRKFANVPKTQIFNNRVIYYFSYHVVTKKLRHAGTKNGI